MLNAIQAGILTSSTKERLEQLEETKRELDRLNIENDKLRNENDLLDAKITNLTTIILNHGINIKKELKDVEES